MSFKGALKCCVCKAFCSKTTGVCGGCGQPCHDKCRQSICCRPCNLCWSKQHRSCVCGKSMRSLGVFVDRDENQQPDTPPNKRRKTSRVTPISVLTCNTSSDKENQSRQQQHPQEVHPHEASKEYLLRVRSQRNGVNDTKWEDCRILTKFQVKDRADKAKTFCTIECRLRKDLGETAPFRPQQHMQ